MMQQKILKPWIYIWYSGSARLLCAASKCIYSFKGDGLLQFRMLTSVRLELFLIASVELNTQLKEYYSAQNYYTLALHIIILLFQVGFGVWLWSPFEGECSSSRIWQEGL